MKVSQLDFLIQGENNMKRALLIVAATLMFLNTLVVPTAAHADGGSTGGNCSGNTGNCKP